MFYLLGSLALLVCLVVLLLLRRDLRQQVLISALVFMALGPISEQAFFADYWTFEPVLPHFVLFEMKIFLEDLLFAFVAVGIMSAIYDVLMRKQTRAAAFPRRLLLTGVLALFQAAAILLVPVWSGLNSIFAAMLAAGVCTLVVLLFRRDLWQAALGTSLICGFGGLVFYSLFLLLPGAVDFLFSTAKPIPLGALVPVFGIPVPLTEILWAACTGSFFGVVYKFASGVGYAEAAHKNSSRASTARVYATLDDLHRELDGDFISRARTDYGAFMAVSSRHVWSINLVRRTAWQFSNLLRRKVPIGWAVAAWAVLPLLVNLLLAPFGLACADKDVIWLAYGGVLLVMFLEFPRLAWTRLICLADPVDDLLMSADQRKQFIQIWSKNDFSYRLQGILFGIGGGIGIFVMAVVHPLLQVAVGFTPAFYLAIFLIGGLGLNAVYWLWSAPFYFRQLSRFERLRMVWNNPAKTPSIREASRLFGFITILAAIGLIWVTIPILYVDIAAFSDTWVAYTVKAIEFIISMGSVVFIAILPQYWLSSLVSKEKNQVLAKLSAEIQALYERSDLEEGQKWALLESKNSLYQAINATSNSVIDLSTVLKYTLAVVSTALPFVLEWLSR